MISYFFAFCKCSFPKVKEKLKQNKNAKNIQYIRKSVDNKAFIMYNKIYCE